MKMPVKAPPIVEPPFSWTGFYIGGNVGYSWGRARTDQTDALTSQTTTRAFVVFSGAETSNVTGFPNGFFPVVGPTTVTTGSTSNRSNVNGFVGGVQVGYNWQVDKFWVLGFETDFQGSGERGSSSGVRRGRRTSGAPA